MCPKSQEVILFPGDHNTDTFSKYFLFCEDKIPKLQIISIIEAGDAQFGIYFMNKVLQFLFNKC